MNSKKLFLIIVSSLSLVLTVGLTAFSLAWYTLNKTSEKNVEIPAEEYKTLVIGKIDGSFGLRPAKALNNAVRDNKHMDVLKVYNSSDSEPSYIETVAQTATYTANIYVTCDEVADVTFDFNAVIASNGEPVLGIVGDSYHPVADADLVADVKARGSNGQITSNSIITVAANSGEPIRLTIEVYWGKCDELMDPEILKADVLLALVVRTTPPTATVSMTPTSS